MRQAVRTGSLMANLKKANRSVAPDQGCGSMSLIVQNSDPAAKLTGWDDRPETDAEVNAEVEIELAAETDTEVNAELGAEAGN